MTASPTLTADLTSPFPGAEVMAIDPTTLHRLWTPARPDRVSASAPAADMGEGDECEDEDDGNLYLGNGVCVVCIDGPLMQRGGWWWDGYQAIHQRVQSALTRPGTRVLVLKINSPGGVAAGCFEAARQIRDDALAARVPVLAYVDEMACSAAYALACVAQTGGLWLPPSGCVGSVGVIATYVDASIAVKREGMRFVVVASGAYKADGHFARPIDPEMEQRLREPVDHLAGLFFAWVAERRRLTPAGVKALEAGVFWGQNAVAYGLADRVGSLPDCLAIAANLANPSTPAPYAGAPARAEVPEESTMSDSSLTPPAAAVETEAPIAASAGVLIESVPSVSLADHDMAIASLSADLAVARAVASVLSGERDALAAQVAALTADLAVERGKVKASETARITAKVDALVGVKITAAERDDELELAIDNEEKFDRRMSRRANLRLDDKRIVPDAGNEGRVTDGAEAAADRLNRLTDEHIKAHPGMARHEAMLAVMRQRPDLCASIPA